MVPDRDRGPEDAAYAAARPITESLTQEQREGCAQLWGYDSVGRELPAGAKPEFIAGRMPKHLFEHDATRALTGLILPLAVMTVSYYWLW